MSEYQANRLRLYKESVNAAQKIYEQAASELQSLQASDWSHGKMIKKIFWNELNRLAEAME